MAQTKVFKSQISGKEYTLQKVPPLEWLQIMDDSEVNGVRKRTKFYPALLENIVVQPKVTLQDFDNFAEVEELAKEAISFQQGK